MGDPVVHFEIGGVDGARSQRFYADLFGWEITPDVAGYGMVTTGSDAGIAGGIMQAPEGRPPWVTVYVSVADLDKALARAQELGGTLVMGRQPLGEQMAFGMFCDPDGNVIGLVQE